MSDEEEKKEEKKEEKSNKKEGSEAPWQTILGKLEEIGKVLQDKPVEKGEAKIPVPPPPPKKEPEPEEKKPRRSLLDLLW